MSVPLSNTNLRVPRGFGNLLEGLAREVLRDQPEDIPTFAAVYFTALLRQREESGLDPAEWGARMEDRFYNNHAFKNITNGDSSSAKASRTSQSDVDKIDQAESFENGDEISQPTQNLSPPSEDLNPVEKLEPQESKTELDESDERGPATTPEISYRGTAAIDICAEELKEIEELREQEETGDGREKGNDDICATELGHTALNSSSGLADVDICAEELQSSLQDEESAYKDTEGSRELIDAHPATVSDSPKSAKGEEQLSESQDVLDSHDTFIFPGAESPIEQEASEELNDISVNEKPVAFPTYEKEETDDPTHDAQYTLSEMTDALFEEFENKNSNVEQIDSNESSDSITAPEEANTYNETHEAELGIESQEARHTSPETERLGESAFEKVGEVAHTGYSVSEFQDENEHFNCVSKSEVTDGGDMSTDHLHIASETALEEVEHVDEKENGPKDINADILPTSLDAQVDGSGLRDSNTSLFDASAEDMKEDDPVLSQQDVSEAEYNTGDHSMNETEMKENCMLDVTTHEAEGASSGPAPEEAVESMEVIPESHAAGSQWHTEEIEADIDHEEQSEDQYISQKSLLDPESKHDQQEECSHPQEEEDIMDIPLDDPEANKAAAKIQAGFRGHMTRKKLKPGDKPGEEVSSSGEALNGSQGDTAGGSEGVETDDTSVPEQ